MTCKLCQKKIANQTGSHITSAFLLSSQIGERGSEKGFLLTTDPNQDYSMNKGDTEIKQDYIFCRDCEKRLGVIEDIYSTEITRKIEKHQFEQNFSRTNFDNGNYKLSSKRLHPIVFHLMIQSIIWRASLSDLPLFKFFELSTEVEERLRFNLDLFLPEIESSTSVQAQKKWLEMVDRCKDIFDLIPLMIVKAENIENKEMTYNFFDNVSKSPYHMIVNEYCILPFCEKTEWIDDFFDLKKEFELNSIIDKDLVEPIIGVFSNDKYLHIIDKIRNLAINQRLQTLEKQCIQELVLKGLPVTSETVKELLIRKVEQIKM